MQLTVAGSGDAFGSGGRLNTCFHVASDSGAFLIDCGASSMIAMSKWKLDPNQVGTIFISHLHGDHFAGLVFWMLHAQHVARRKAPLDVAGPPGIEARFVTACEALYPGATKVKSRFELRFHEYQVGGTIRVGEARASAFEVVHPSGAPSCALRIETGGRVLSYSGDTEWTECLVDVAAGADLFICECYRSGPGVPYHIDWQTLETHLPRLTARRILLTHMSDDMWATRTTIAGLERILIADDGLRLAL